MIRSAAAAILSVLLVSGCCATPPADGPPSALQTAIEQEDALAIADALEGLIADGKDTEQDRQLAYDQVAAKEENTAAYAYARAAVAGRLVQQKGLTSAFLAREMEAFAQRSRTLDPNFRNGIATRMLGTLYVLAPATLLSNGDSEKGLELLEGLVKAHPEVLENHLRYAEALIALGDPVPATESLCHALRQKAKLRKDEQALVEKLFVDAGAPPCAPEPPASASPSAPAPPAAPPTP